MSTDRRLLSAFKKFSLILRLELHFSQNLVVFVSEGLNLFIFLGGFRIA